MRMSCNGCRVLRKGCSEDCSIRPCLEWIKNPEHQGNATLFLAKFYGRAGLMNLINAGPIHLRPAIFKSLLYEACGRMVNPIYGALGLLWTGSWQLCQEAMDEVLKGRAITQLNADSAAASLSGDIRHICKGDLPFAMNKLGKKSRKLFKRSANRRILSPTSSAMNSGETVEESLLEERGGASEESDVELELKLGFEAVHHSHSSSKQQ